ncbi:MAG: UDP-N-acetylmuramoyl-L-alanine--D-glutamate ligase, partial [Firmicutes bacterium]|nr:UDP-N-acetylmuramoyl-L-alanine--D-glutamate ligase [Bacillota bacterium]
KKDIKIRGMHNIENICEAIAATEDLVDAETQKEAIKEFTGVEHRLEFVREINGIKFYNDSKATNVDAGIKALEALKDKNIILIGGGYDKKNDFYDWIKKFKSVKKLILIGEVKNKIAKQCDELGFKDYYVCEDDLELAIKKAIEFGESGDYVLLSPACASWDMFKNFEERGDMFKKIINKI